MEVFFDKSVFAERLRLERGSKSQVQMAAMLKMKQPMYARYESGKTVPSSELLFWICSTLGVSADWLLGLSEERNPARGGVSVSASHSAVAINGHANTVIMTAKKRKTK